MPLGGDVLTFKSLGIDNCHTRLQELSVRAIQLLHKMVSTTLP